MKTPATTYKLPQVILMALARYHINYFNSQRQHVGSTSNVVDGKLVSVDSYKEGTQWNKDADLDNVSAVCKKIGWGYQACAGTFWFSKPSHNTKTQYKSYEISHSTWPLAKIKVKPKWPLGEMKIKVTPRRKA